MKSPNVQYLPGLDHLRAAAALLVLFYHGLHLLSLIPRAAGKLDFRKLWVISKNPLIALLEEGHTGVALFMVLSGFVLSVSAIGREIEYRPFIRNRLLRVYPLVVVLAVAGVAAHPSRYTLLSFAQALLFQGNFPGTLSVEPFSSMFWTLAVEFQFYLAFPFLHRFIEREGVRWALALIALATVLRACATLLGTSNVQEIYYAHLLGRIDQFVLGMLAARVYHRYRNEDVPWGVLSLVALAIALAAVTFFNQRGGWLATPWWKVCWPTIEGLAWAGVITCYAPFSRRVPRLISAPLAWIGTVSYSMYMLNFLCFYVVARIIPYQMGAHPNPQSQYYTLYAVLPFLLAGSALSYYAIERPFLQLRVRYLSDPKPSAPAAS